MGKIYKDIERNDTGEENKSLETLLSVGSLIEGVDCIKFRDTEINRVYNIMTKTDFRTVLLVGDYGSGKRSIIEGYVNRLEKNMRSERVVEVDFNDVLMKAHNSDFSQVVNDIFNAATDENNYNIVLVLNNLGHLLNLNCYGNAGFSFVNTLTKAIEEESIRIIATATTDEYKMIEDMFKRVLDFFTVIKLTELTKDETAEIIKDDLNFFENSYATMQTSISRTGFSLERRKDSLTR